MAKQLETAILEVGADQVAAFICEPIVGSSLGAVAATTGYLQRVREICDQHDVLLIFDEIMCGSGRTGDYFAHQYDGVRPDIVTLAKGIGGGYQPLAAVIMNSRIADVLNNAGFAHGHTYIGHPTACAAGVAVLRVIERDHLLPRAKALGEKLLPILRAELGDHENVGDIRGRGLFAGIELVANRDSRSGFTDARTMPDRLRLAAMAAGLIVYPGGLQLDGKTVPHIMLAPPMIAVEDELLDGAKRLRHVIESVLRG
jgi:adenosylmethionine-8-amino-7-oxononanoate aminotransferase